MGRVSSLGPDTPATAGQLRGRRAAADAGLTGGRLLPTRPGMGDTTTLSADSQ